MNSFDVAEHSHGGVKHIHAWGSVSQCVTGVEVRFLSMMAMKCLDVFMLCC